MVTSQKFEYFIVLVIIFSTFTLIMQNPFEDPNSSTQKLWKRIDQITTLIFVGECLLKIIAFGLLFNGPSSYLRQFSNVFDCIIVTIAIISEVQSDNSSLGAFKTLRICRILRPLRIISRSEQLKVAIFAITESVPQMINLFIFCILFFFLFGIFGVNYFKGAYYDCDMENISAA